MNGILKLCTIRKKELAFDLKGSFEVLALNESIVSMLLYSRTNQDKLIALVNVSDSAKSLDINCYQLGFFNSYLTDLISKNKYIIPSKGESLRIVLSLYQICWLR